MTRARNLARLVPDSSGLIPNSNLAPIAASLLSGQVADANIAAVAASKLTGTVADANIASVSATKVSGQLLDAQMSSGSVLQVVYSNTGTEYSTSSTSYQNGASASITPSSASSKIVVLITANAAQNDMSAWADHAIYRGGTLIEEYPYDMLMLGYTGQASMRQSWSTVDSPATTSSVTYYIKQRSQAGNRTVYLNKTQIILMEIAG